MHEQRAGFGMVAIARHPGVRVTRAANHNFRILRADPGDLHWRGNLRHEDACLVAEPVRGERRGDSVIAARRRRHARLGHRARQQVVERPARLERAGMLGQFELETDMGALSQRAVGCHPRASGGHGGGCAHARRRSRRGSLAGWQAWWTSGGSFHRSGPTFRLDRMPCHPPRTHTASFRHELPSAAHVHRALAPPENFDARPGRSGAPRRRRRRHRGSRPPPRRAAGPAPEIRP